MSSSKGIKEAYQWLADSYTRVGEPIQIEIDSIDDNNDNVYVTYYVNKRAFSTAQSRVVAVDTRGYHADNDTIYIDGTMEGSSFRMVFEKCS